jgi:hypothetical protein
MSLAVGEFSGDGYPDLAVAEPQEAFLPRTVRKIHSSR